MKLYLESFVPFIEKNTEFFRENRKRTVSILKELVLKTNKLNKNILEKNITIFYDSIFLDISNNFEIFQFIAKLNNIDAILNRTFLFLINKYIKYIFKEEDSIEKLKIVTKLCDFYITYLNHYKENINTENSLPKEIIEYFSNSKPIIYFTVFKGVPISYKTHIKKIDNDSFDVKINPHQIISAKFQKVVYILNPDTTQTFIANIKDIKQNGNIVTLNNITNVKRNTIKRNFIRVQPKEKTFINIEYKEKTFKGEVHDLSLRGLGVISIPIDISLSESEKLNIFLNLTYNNNYINIHTKAELVSITKLNNSQYKYHFYFILPSIDERNLEKYICYREQEIINELNQYIQKSLL